jgi:hypothetical protein
MVDYARVRVYFNLHKKVWSIKDKKSNRVIAHSNYVVLTDCKFIVSETARLRVLSTGRKNVHAYVEGFLREDIQVNEHYPAISDKVTYNPRKVSTFCYVAEDGQPDATRPIYDARLAVLNATDRSVMIKL